MAEFVQQKWIFTGTRLAEGDKLGLAFLDTQGVDKFFVPSKRSLLTRFVIGGEYELGVTTAGDQAQLGGARFIQKLSDPRAAEWEAKSKAAEAVVREAKAERKASEESALLKALEPIIRAGRTTNPQGKAALKVWVLATMDKAWRYHDL